MKKLLALIFAIFTLCAATAFAAENKISLSISITPTDAIVTPATARFNIFGENGEWLANRGFDIFKDTREAAVEFDLPDFEPGKKFTIVPTIGLTNVTYEGNTYGIGESITLDTAEKTAFDISVLPLYIEPTGVKTDKLIFYFDAINKFTPIPSDARFNLFDKDGNWLKNDAVAIKHGGERYKLVFDLPEYYTGEKFFICPTVGMTSLYYNGRTYEPGEMIEVETYADINTVGNFFYMDLTPLYKLPDKDRPDEFALRAESFINSTGIDSKTDYFIWVSKYNYKVVVFMRENGRWSCIKSFDCSIGAPKTPTITGVFEYYQYQPRWTYDTYYVGPIMRFAKGGYAIHSTLLRYNGNNADGRLRMKISHGCVRVEQPNVQWMVDYIPIGTRVYVTE